MNAALSFDGTRTRTADALESQLETSRAFFDCIGTFTNKYVKEWQATEGADPNWGPVVSEAEKDSHQRDADLRLEEIRRLLLRCPKLPDRRGPWRRKLLKVMRHAAECGCGVAGRDVALFFTESAMEATRQFIREARGFEPAISEQDLFQALRNLWVIHSIQLLLHRPINLSPALFAYSMLYPSTDNYLDDPNVAGCSKAEFGRWLDQILAGHDRSWGDRRAEQVRRLIGFIEAYYARAEYPEVYLSLRAIHQAQMESVSQQGRDGNFKSEQMLRVTVAKGGTSVLADAYLIRGRLNLQEADFMFGYGVALQLMDDIQDLSDDVAKKHNTILTVQAGARPLDEIVSRLWRFVTNQLQSQSPFGESYADPVKRLIRENCKRILLQAVALKPDFYTEKFIATVENYCPFRFSFLRARAKSLADERVQVMATLKGTHQISSLFQLFD